MISLHFFRNRSRLEMVREGAVGFSLALCSFLLDKSWRQIGPRMSTTRSVPVWIHSSKAAGIKGTFPGKNVRWCQMFFLFNNFLILYCRRKLPEQLLGWRQIRRQKALEPQLFPVLAFSHAATRKPDLERAFLSPLRGNKETPLPEKGNKSQRRQTCLIKNSKPPWRSRKFYEPRETIQRSIMFLEEILESIEFKKTTAVRCSKPYNLYNTTCIDKWRYILYDYNWLQAI